MAAAGALALCSNQGRPKVRYLLGWALTLSLILPAAAQAPQMSVLGRWLSESGKGVIEIYHCADRLCGKIVWLQEAMRDGKPATDRNNPEPELRSRPICGLIMLGGFRPTEPQHWGDGWIYSPENGKTYHATMTLESPTVLKLRGYVGIPLFGETQTWTRADPKLGTCRA